MPKFARSLYLSIFFTAVVIAAVSIIPSASSKEPGGETGAGAKTRLMGDGRLEGRKREALDDAIASLASKSSATGQGSVQSPLFPTQIWHGARFGYAVAVDGDTAVVGAEDDLDLQHPTDRDGAAYIFTFDGINWTQQQRLSENVTFTGYGRSVAISGDTVAVAYPGGGDEAVYVYTRTTGIWTLQQKVQPSGAINPQGFGAYIDLSGDSLIVGGVTEGVLPNRYVTTYFFQRAGRVWTQQLRTILPSGSTAISGDYALAGNPTDSSVSQFQGSVAVFRRVKGAWTQVQTLRPSDGLANGQFGSGVSIDGNTAIVGAWGRSDPNSPGAAYVFALENSTWVEKAKLIPPDGLPRDSFGDSVSISGDRVFVGAPSDGFTSAPGAAYFFRRDGLEWKFEEKFTAASPAAQDLFGHDVAISGNNAIIGVARDDYGGFSDAGSAVTVVLGANAAVKMRRPNEASLTQPSIDLGLTNIDAPLVYKADREAIGAAPVVDKGLVADGVTPLLFDIEIADETITGTVDTEVAVEISYGGTISGDAIEERMLYLDNGSWSTSPLFTFTEIENRHFAYLKPIGSDELQFDTGSNEIEVRLQLLNKANNIAIGTKRFYIRKPPVALIHGYNTDGTWGEDFKDELAVSRPLGIGGEDFVRTIRYGQEPAGAAVNAQEATTLSFAVLANKALLEFNDMRDEIDDDWALTRYDVVAHSQGGVLSRMLTSRNANSFVSQPFRNSDNFNRGRFHRVVTIGSPHNGTRIVRWTAALRQLNQQTWMPVSMASSLSSFIFWSGNAQYKFDPIGAEILNINRTDAVAPWLPDTDAKFHLVATTVNNGMPPSDTNSSLADANIGLASPNGTVVLPGGSDGVVDFDAMIATTPSGGQSAPTNAFRITTGNQISHAYFDLPVAASYALGVGEDLFGGDSGQVISDIVGRHVIRALDQSNDIPASDRVFGPFQLPAQLHPTTIAAIQSAANQWSGVDDAIQIQSGPGGEGVSSPAANYTYNFQLPAGESFARPVLWTAERVGAAGTGATGITVANVAGFPGRAALTADTTIAGDIVLRGTATAVSGKTFVGEPVLVSSTDPDPLVYSRTSISIDPASGIYQAGEGVLPALYENYTNIQTPGNPPLKLRRWFYDQNIQMVSTAPAVVDPSAKIEWKFPGPGTATVNVTWRGLNTSATFTIYPANGLPPTPTPSPTPPQCVTLYGASNGFNVPGDNEIYRIDPATGAVSNRVDITLAGFTMGNTNALAARPSDNVLFAVITTRNPQTRRLVTVDPNTGVATQIGVLSTNISDLAFRADGTLWAVSGDGAATEPETLYTVNQSTAALTRQFALGNGADGETIEFHTNGLLYHSSGNVPALFESVNVDTQAVTPIASVNAEMFAMGQNPANGQLYGSDVFSNLFTINIATGARTPIGHINSANDNRGLAFVPVTCSGPTPTPTPVVTPTPTPSVSPTPSPSPSPTPLYTRGDYDGDNKTDLTVWRPTAFAPNLSAFYTFRSTNGSFFGIQFGNAGDTAIAGDFDGDNKTDFGVSRFTSADGVDMIYLESSTNTAKFPVWGNTEDIFISGDYDGDKKTDVMAWRPSDGTWYIVNSSGANGGFSFITHGQNGDKPYAMDTDGDGKSNLVYFRPSATEAAAGDWVIRNNNGTSTTINFGLPTDIPVPADYDGDDKDDIAVFRDGLWIVLKSSTGEVEFMPFGAAGDIPVPGDYDGDNLYDRAVYREGIWHMLRSSLGYTGFQFGAPTDTAMPKAYIP